MQETAAELAALQELLDRSATTRNEHLLAIMTPQRRLSAGQIVTALTGMQVLVVATVTGDRRAAHEPASTGISYMADGCSARVAKALKARHIKARPAVSATYVDGERIAVFTHGRPTTSPRPRPTSRRSMHTSPATTVRRRRRGDPDIVFFRLQARLDARVRRRR